MTTTSTFSGKCDGRNSSRVLRPPGGGSSDIFGATPAPEQPLPKPSKRHDSNDIFGTPTTAGDTPGKVNQRITKSNVFGPAEPSPEPSKPRKQDANSDIFGPPKEAKASGKKMQESPITGANNTPEQPFHPSTRVRQPPGGASSKLW